MKRIRGMSKEEESGRMEIIREKKRIERIKRKKEKREWGEKKDGENERKGKMKIIMVKDG